MYVHVCYTWTLIVAQIPPPSSLFNTPVPHIVQCLCQTLLLLMCNKQCVHMGITFYVCADERFIKTVLLFARCFYPQNIRELKYIITSFRNRQFRHLAVGCIQGSRHWGYNSAPLDVGSYILICIGINYPTEYLHGLKSNVTYLNHCYGRKWSFI